MTQNLMLAPDALFYREQGALILTSPRARAHVSFPVESIPDLFAVLQNDDEAGWLKLSAQDITSFCHQCGLMADPTGNANENGEELTGLPLRERLRQLRLLVQDDGAFLDYLGSKTSVLDNEHHGNLHQNISSYQIRHLRTKDSWRWWHDQKFAPDGKSLKHGYYKWIQGAFFDSYFSRIELKNKRVLDFACGNGFYSHHFWERGANVTGIDTSKDLIALARGNFPAGPEFHGPESASACKALLASFAPDHFDVIYLSDALLLFFHVLNDKEESDLSGLLDAFHRLLKSDGRFYLMEPNATFWLPLRIGRDTAQTALVTEYRNLRYTVAPTPDHVIGALSQSGFVVENFMHPPIDEHAREIDARAYHYAKNFPLWDFYVIKKGQGAR